MASLSHLRSQRVMPEILKRDNRRKREIWRVAHLAAAARATMPLDHHHSAAIWPAGEAVKSEKSNQAISFSQQAAATPGNATDGIVGGRSLTQRGR